MSKLIKIKNIPKLTKTEEKYLKGRGFEIVKGKPPTNEAYPYLTLTAPRIEKLDSIRNSDYGLKYHHSKGCGTDPCTKLHPSVFTTDSLVKSIEKIVAENSIHDCEDGLFHTTIGTPIKIFVIDNKWMLVAKELAKNYKNN